MYISIFIFLLGLVVGSFLNVVILRLDENYPIKGIMGRSHCPNCKKKLNWYELIPVFSFLIQRGKCRGCGKKISWQYPIIETATGLLFLLIFNFQFLIFNNEILNFETLLAISYKLLANILYLWIIFSIFIVITIYDIRHKIIPDSMAFLFAGLSLLFMLVTQWGNLAWLEVLAGPILATPFAVLWFVSEGRWIGFGDAKLALGMGWFLGLVDGLSAIILSFWIGSVFGIFLILLSKLQSLSFINKNFTIKSEIPFAPFLILGTILIFFFHWDVLGLKVFFI
ncbi:TPA: hypothetical protein DCZ46_00590 [Candidatus Campbellbacteria bacterium]|nr:MAG: prepilin peptidase, leader peptidase (prepilin peptidase) / N-methyltransferase [Candidatus Campbellbacteria bacterium GW2011_OD1_34_28]KKP75415.1 MAG: Type 4 prepilin-like protein leader peptide-processing enzyme [Candidatus Campbellbacteria bacterium GW2011_GWD2_35_24]KKP76024.1 MAG: prepilin peptidase, leader peptidase (prepilin peptidase) / N-methyltransferase [Candidatus Campbellbacteria bacterium GW2011_GWC2_35_28]KKP77213.1 MAG: Type 4 prepilin-like protein leader peptide-processi